MKYIFIPEITTPRNPAPDPEDRYAAVHPELSYDEALQQANAGGAENSEMERESSKSTSIQGNMYGVLRQAVRGEQ